MELVERLVSLRRREHTATCDLIAALCECVRSEAHLAAGHASLWSLLVERLDYSPAAASRRNAAVKIALRFPRVLEMLRVHRTSLTCLAKVAFLLDEPGFDRVLRSIDGASAEDVDRLVARHRPRSKPAERVRRVVVEAAGSAGASSGSAAEVSSPGTGSASTRSSSAAELGSGAVSIQTVAISAGELPLLGPPTEGSPSAAKPTTQDPPSTAKPATEERVVLTFSVTAEEYEALQRAKAIASRKHGPGVTLEQTFHEMLALFVGREPKRKGKSKKRTNRRTRHVPAKVRREVERRDQKRCSYRAPDGKRCTATHDLQLDHVVPYAMGGEHTAANLRLLCAKHNRWRSKEGTPVPRRNRSARAAP